MRIDDFIDASNNISSIEPLTELFLKALNDYGFDRAICAYLNPYNLQLDISTKLLIRYPDDWMEHYIANDYANHDPVCRWVLRKQNAFTWKDIQQNWMSDKEKEVMKNAQQAGFHNGGAVGIHLKNGTSVGFGFARSQKDKTMHKTELHRIHAICNQFLIILEDIEKKSPFQHPKIKLTDKEKDVISWCAQGKSNSCIADIMGISEHAVNFHLRNIYKKLDTNNKTLAVLKAYRAQLMDTLPN